jgi:RNA polymerase sigma factor (sigma-70 family)
MKDPDDPLRNTRRSLVERLGNLDDQASWRTFFDRYGGLLYRVARAAGLTDSEAQEAVQETVITVCRNIGGLRYDPAAGSFKGWLLQTSRWRIADQFRRRERQGRLEASLPPSLDADGGGPRTGLIERSADPRAPDLEAAWDIEWREHLLTSALARVRKQVDPAQFQIFDCYVTKGWPATRVARELGVHIAQVYLGKHRVSALLKKAIAALERGSE